MEYSSEFAYAWRFIDEKYNKLPESDLRLIYELSIEETKHFWNENICNKISYYPICDILKNNKMEIENCGWGDENIESVTTLKLSKLFKNETYMYFFWDSDNAIKTTCSIFIKYWADFCYGSDYANVIYLTAQKIYIYHENILLTALPN